MYFVAIPSLPFYFINRFSCIVLKFNMYNFFIHFALFYLSTYLSIIARSFALSLVYSLGLTNKSFLVVSFGCMLFSVCRLTDTEIYVNDDGSY